ncbi:Ldh family oxidoreductase [Litchfieldella xinjiangensis]|uniref:Ldh family oxidoreductase n=1 Tax=Litchfieldella xinjiangensis TaxID=1166948 RepID=UPI0005BCCDA1|nr:Ldh family oxidoreductase [Halomonas xinjiangensis]
MARLSLNEIEQLSQDILQRHGFSPAQVQAVADTVVAGQRDECHSHGLYRLLGCIDTLKAGKVVPNAKPVPHDRAPAIVLVDAGGGFAPLAFRTGLPLLIDKASQQGLAALMINHCVHFSALWVEIEQLTEAGLVALACNPSHAWVAPAGGRLPVFGTNPIAFGWPRPGKAPYIFDFATSAIARGDIELHRRDGVPIPTGWGVDGEGRASNDAATVLDKGAMLPFGGHKGSALATMIELIAGPMIDDFTSAESLEWDAGCQALPYHGELILAFDPRRFLGDRTESSLQRAEMLFDSIAEQGARLPSQRRYQARMRSQAEGVEIPDALHEDLKALLR